MKNDYRIIVAFCLGLVCFHCNAQSTIQMEESGGVYKIPCTINGLKLKMIFDPGAANVCISETVALMMLENDYLSPDDIKGTSQSQVADGRIVDHTVITLKKIQIGDKTLTNVDAVVIHGQDAPLLFGQSALKKLGHYSIAGDKLVLGTVTTNKRTDLYDNESRKWLYNVLVSEGYNMGEYLEYDKAMESDEESRRWCYERAREHGYNVGKDYEEFLSLVGPQSNNPQQKKLVANRINVLSEEAVDQLFYEALEAYHEGIYSVATEKYEVLLQNGQLNVNGIMDLADCYYYTGRKKEALEAYLEIKEDIESEFPQSKVSLYYQIGRCLWNLEEFDAAILYFEKVKLLAGSWSEMQHDAVYFLSSIYKDNKGNAYRACKIVDEYILQYLSFMDIKATYCWTKLYKDIFLANLYFERSLLAVESDYEKYIVISAAWGNKEAQEFCKKYEINYSSKPYKYEY